jgi:hypothetical protein
MLRAVLLKRGNTASLHLSDPTLLSDYSRALDPDDRVDGQPVWSFDEGSHLVTEFPDDPPPLEELVEELGDARTLDNGSVVYDEDKVTAYFSDEGRSVPQAFATWAKEWTPTEDGRSKLRIIKLGST